MSLLAAAVLALAQDAPGHWPQWRGPKRDHVSTETGLLGCWPPEGPKLLWTSKALGDGFPPVSVAGGRIYGLGFKDDHEHLTALDGAGQVVWSQPIGPSTGEMRFMRYLSQRPVTVDDDLLFAFTGSGSLLCLEASGGRVLWQKDYARDFGGRASSFFLSDVPLVDGPLLICKPGGPKGAVVALDKRSGKLVWACAALKENAAHAPLVLAEIGGVRQVVVLSMQSVAGVAVKTGALLWRVERPGRTAVMSTPVYHDGLLLVSSGFGQGCNAFQLARKGDAFDVREAYAGQGMINRQGGMVLVGEHVYGADERGLTCMEFRTGTVAWQERTLANGTLSYADGRLIHRTHRGTVVLVEATPESFREMGRFDPPERSKEPAWSHPVVAGGRLYLKDVEILHCYDLRGPDYREPARVWATPPAAPKAAPPPIGKGRDAAFVPTPMDVVEKMIELAGVGKEDVVVDLGSGDGRIVIAAAKRHGCRAVGVENDPALVRASREKAKEAGLEALVTIREQDLFAADLGGASVVTLYLGEPNNQKLLPRLRTLKAGARIVSHMHGLGEDGPPPDRTLRMTSAEDGEEHRIHLWTLPLREDR